MTRAFAAGLLLLPAVAAACGSSKKASGTTTSAAPPSAVSDAVAKTLKAGSEHLDLSAQVAASGRTIRLSGSGDFDSSKHVGALHAKLSLSGIDSTIDELQSGGTIYVSSPLFGAVLPAGKSWLKLDLADAAKTLGVNASALTAQDPSSALEQLKALSGLTEAGTQTIGGVQTTRYRGTIDVSKLPAASKTLVRSTGATFGPVDVWVGSDGYVHRMRVVTSASAGGQSAKTTLTTTLSDFGESVSATIPPASKTVDASTMSIPGLTG